jgi:CheY-like chemotaxis protein
VQNSRLDHTRLELNFVISAEFCNPKIRSFYTRTLDRTGYSHLKMTADSRPTVLIVEDDTSLQSLLEALLGRDYRITVVGDGKEALEHLQWDTPNLVILDVTIPHVDGLDICSRIKRIKRFRDTRVIVMTASMDERTHDAANLAKADAFVSKPIVNEQFRQLVRELLNKTGAPKSFTDSAFTGSLADASADRTPPSSPTVSTELKMAPAPEKPTELKSSGIIKAELDESEFAPQTVETPSAKAVQAETKPEASGVHADLFADWDDSSQEETAQNVSKDNSADF